MTTAWGTGTLPPPAGAVPGSTTPASLALLRRVAEEVELVDDQDWAWRGRVVPRPPTPAPQALPAALAAGLYRHYHLGGDVDRAQEVVTRPVFALEDAELGRRLRAAAGDRVHWQPGWRLLRREGGQLVVEDGGLRLHAREDEVRPATAQEGDPVLVAFPADRPYASPGFYTVVGRAGPVPSADPTPDSGVVRCYRAMVARDAPAALAGAVHRLDAARLPFTLKALNAETSYPRPDALVAYVARADVPIAVPALAAGCAGAELPGPPPALTLHTAAGLGLADDPPGPLSFGQHRCHLLARGLLTAGAGSSPQRRLALVLRSLADAGLDPAALHLGPGRPPLEVPPC